MLQRIPQSLPAHSDEHWPFPPEREHLDFDKLLAAGRRQLRVMLMTGAACLAIGTAFMLTEIPKFTASADLLIEYRHIALLEDSYLPNPLAAFDGIVSSELEVIRSEAVARHVVHALDLLNDPRFTSAEASPASQLVAFVQRQFTNPPSVDESEGARLKAAKAELKSNLKISRVGPAFILRIEYTSHDPALAADVANAFANGYLHDQREVKHETMRQAGEWLRVRVVDLRERLAEAELAAIRSRRQASDDTALVALNALEREAETFRNLHTTFLQRYQEALHQQTVPSADARIINHADMPNWTSYPPKMILLALSLMAGGALGLGLAAFREYRDQGFRTGAQVRELLRLDFLGILPKLRVRSRFWKKRGAPEPAEAGTVQTRPAEGTFRHVIDNPQSNFAECLRTAATAADLKLPDQKMRVIGVTSVLREEGRSTAAKNLASMLAERGSKTLLIDADAASPGLSAALAPDAEVTLLDVVLHGQSLRDAIQLEAETGLAFLPSSGTSRLSRTSDLMGSPGFANLLREASSFFDYVIVDLPPMAEGMDVSAAATRMDGFICVIEWARTSRKLVQKAYTVDQAVWEKCLGIIFNKVDAKRLRRYEGYSSESHFEQRQKTGFRV